MIFVGFRFRKSANFGPLRVNFSKSGIGYSLGGKGFRVTKKAKGGIRTTSSIPGTGISYVKDYASTSGSGTDTTTSDSQGTMPPNMEQPPKKELSMLLRWGLSVLGWFFIVTSIFLSAAEVLAGFIGTAIGVFLVYRFSPRSCSKPIYKRKWFLATFVCWVLFALMSLVPTTPKITALTLDCDSSIQLDISKTMNIPILVEATDAETDEIRFLTSDESVISFYRLSGDDHGLMGCITPVSEGTAYITVSNGDVTSNKVHVTVIDSARIAEEEAARVAAEEEAARIAAEEEAARIAAEEEAARIAAEEEAARIAAEEEAEAQETMVWIPQSGSKYHSRSGCSNMKNPSQVTLSQAEAWGYTPCKKCH